MHGPLMPIRCPGRSAPIFWLTSGAMPRSTRSIARTETAATRFDPGPLHGRLARPGRTRRLQERSLRRAVAAATRHRGSERAGRMPDARGQQALTSEAGTHTRGPDSVGRQNHARLRRRHLRRANHCLQQRGVFRQRPAGHAGMASRPRDRPNLGRDKPMTWRWRLRAGGRPPQSVVIGSSLSPERNARSGAVSL